jgi:hypothetical protein
MSGIAFYWVTTEGNPGHHPSMRLDSSNFGFPHPLFTLTPEKARTRSYRHSSPWTSPSRVSSLFFDTHLHIRFVRRPKILPIQSRCLFGHRPVLPAIATAVSNIDSLAPLNVCISVFVGCSLGNLVSSALIVIRRVSSADLWTQNECLMVGGHVCIYHA